jgi:hypothetical protein
MVFHQRARGSLASAKAFLFWLKLGFIIIAALIEFFGGKWKRDKFLVIRGHGHQATGSPFPGEAKTYFPHTLS